MRNGSTDFLKAAKARTTETVAIGSAKAFVTSLSIKEVNNLSKPFQGDSDKDPAELTNLFILACVKDAKGAAMFPSLEDVEEMSPGNHRLVSEAVARVNGFTVPGN